ncbi:L-threonylcarbamoyladenylate synthase [Paenibacillus pini]|nr:L-threonylcarbamoyladenylate synthase [Paenibacillus pini]
MKSEIIAEHTDNDPLQLALEEAAALLQRGDIVAFPTETVYGLGANARMTEAVEAVFRAKGRPSDNPLIVHIADVKQLDEMVVSVDNTSRRLMEAFWPGPLTLVLPVKPDVLSPRVTAGLDTVAIRMPDHPIALRLIARANCPVAAPSANRSGRPSPTLASHVLEDLEGHIAGIVDGGATGVGVESTVVQVQPNGSVLVLRPGGITLEQLRNVAGVDIVTDPGITAAPHGENQAPRSPGMKYTHYAPKGKLTLVQGDSPSGVADLITSHLKEATSRGEKTGLLVFDEHVNLYCGSVVSSLQSMGSLSHLETAAHRLYAILRQMDDEDVTFILSETCPEEGLGAAVMNRLQKAAGMAVIQLNS